MNIETLDFLKSKTLRVPDWRSDRPIRTNEGTTIPFANTLKHLGLTSDQFDSMSADQLSLSNKKLLESHKNSSEFRQNVLNYTTKLSERIKDWQVRMSEESNRISQIQVVETDIDKNLMVVVNRQALRLEEVLVMSYTFDYQSFLSSSLKDLTDQKDQCQKAGYYSKMEWVLDILIYVKNTLNSKK